MTEERRSKPRPPSNPLVSQMTAAELDAAIKELNEKVRVLLSERRLRERQLSLQGKSDDTAR